MIAPSINTTGKFELKNPFVAIDTVVYTVIAVRDFSDLYIRGIDVYKQYYVSVGLVNNTSINGGTFQFDNESAAKPKIVTLKGSDDTIIYVPSTYITKVPAVSNVMYSRIILSADLGALPDNVSVDAVIDDINELITSRCGIVANTKINRSHTTQQPTPDEHDILENSRTGLITETTNNYSEINRLKSEIQLANDKIVTMTNILVENKLI